LPTVNLPPTLLGVNLASGPVGVTSRSDEFAVPAVPSRHQPLPEVAVTVTEDVFKALRQIDDPEYPGISVVDMGMIGAVDVFDERVSIELIVTFSGCPATAMISACIAEAVQAATGIDKVEVWRSAQTWDTTRLSDSARDIMARDFTVAVQLPGKPAQCPRCGKQSLVTQSLFGPARCRSIYRCTTCNEPIETMTTGPLTLRFKNRTNKPSSVEL